MIWRIKFVISNCNVEVWPGAYCIGGSKEGVWDAFPQGCAPSFSAQFFQFHVVLGKMAKY